jgi:hypothetical protein
MKQSTDIRKIVKLTGSDNIIIWQSDFKRLAQMEGIWEHFLDNSIEFYSEVPQSTYDRFRLLTSPMEIRSNTRIINQESHDRVAYQEIWKAYSDFQLKKEKARGVFTSSVDSSIQIYADDHDTAKSFYD